MSLIALLALGALAQPKEIVLSMELTNDKPYVAARINGFDTAVVLDTGAGASVLDADFAKRVGATVTAPLRAEGVGGTMQGSFVKGVSATVGGMVQPIGIALSLRSLNSLEGRQLNGILGADFLSTAVFQFDYLNRKVTVNPTSPAKGSQFAVEFAASRPVIRVELSICGRLYPLRALVDTGASSCLDLTDAFVSGHQELRDLPGGPEMVVAGGVGGMVRGRYVRGDELRLGPITIKRPIVQLTTTSKGNIGAASAYDAVIGGEILKRLTVVVDYGSKTIVLARNPLVESPVVADSSGLALTTRSSEFRRFDVRMVVPGSPAAEAGIYVGDELVSIGGVDVRGFTLSDLRGKLRQPGTVVAIEVRRNAVRLQKSLTLRELY